MSRPITVAAIQLGPSPDNDRVAVAARLRRLVAEVADRGAQLAVFPELALTPYFPVKRPRGDASDDRYFDGWPPPAGRELLATAARGGVALVLPFAEIDEDGGRYNAAAIVGRDGALLGMYRKVHVPRAVEFEPGRANAYESEWFRPGNLGFPVYDVGPAKVGTLICYDRHFPEGARSLALAGAEIVALCSNSPTYRAAWRQDTWDLICRMRAYENVLFLVAAAKAGQENGVEYVGRSCVVSPVGQILAQSEAAGDDVVIATFDLDQIGEERRRRRYLAERRPEQYGLLVREPIVARPEPEAQ